MCISLFPNSSYDKQLPTLHAPLLPAELNIPKLISRPRPLRGDRKVVDLLFFPTGGGKTEAYLGLAACTLLLRRMQNPGITGAGVSVLMRYTLRLLTLDQLGREIGRAHV